MLTFCKCRVFTGTNDHSLNTMASHVVRGIGVDVKFITLAMRITAAILLFFSLHVTAKSVSQTITLSGKDIPMKTVFDEIRKQSGYVVFYNNEIIEHARPVTINAEDQPLTEFLDNTLHQQGLDYEIQNKTIVLKKNGVDLNALKEDIPIDVRGKVVDENGEPLEGITVTVKGTDVAVATNANGHFILNNIDESAVLIITGITIEQREIKVQGKSELSIVAIRKTTSLNEVVVNKGYYSEKLRNTVGNVATIKASDIEKQPVQNALLALAGRIPGLFITQPTGLPGSGVTVRIQGENSLESGNDPLYIIDGVPYSSQMLPNIGSILGSSGGRVINGVQSGSGNPLNYINPADIESIDVLKDADATAIYGSRAGNGAILITTKKGKAGETKVEINIQNGWGKVTRKLDLLNTQQYLEMRHEAKTNDNAPIYPTDYDINGFWDTTRYTDWQKELIGHTAQYKDVQATVSGGNANTQFLIGAGYHKETTVFPGDLEDNKGSFHFNVNNISTNQKFKIQLSGNYQLDNNNLVFHDLTPAALQLAPNAPAIYNADGTLNWMPDATGTSTWNNPLASVEKSYKNETRNLISSLNLSYVILPGLEISSRFGYNELRVNEFSGNPISAVNPELRPYSSPFAIYSNSSISSWIVEPQINLKKDLFEGVLDLLVGSTILQNNSEYLQKYGIGFSSDQVMENIQSAPNVVFFGSGISVYKYNALFAKFNYNWLGKYLVNLTARRDGSSRFGPENRFHNFGAVGLGWIFSEETIFKSGLPFISFGKLRGSYGTTGNDQIGDYQFLNLYNPTSVGVPYQNRSGLEVNGHANPYFSWEETKKIQVGLDIGLFKDRILLNNTYARNRSSNQLLGYPLPSTTGFIFIPAINFPATVQNTSWEISLSSTNVTRGAFTWSSNFNITLPKNKLVAFPNIESSSHNGRLFIGQPITVVKAFKFGGVDPDTGVYQFVDHDEKLTSTPTWGADQTVLINPLPKFYGGFQNSFAYRGFQLDVLLQFTKQVKPNFLFGSEYGAAFNRNEPVSVLGRWQKPGDVSSIQKFNSDFSLFSQVFYASQSDAGYTDASYIRLKNLSISWSIPEYLKRKLNLRVCKFYVHAQNLLTITNYKGMDPENGTTLSLPPLKVVTVGMQLGL